jgi:hypothetical protein
MRVGNDYRASIHVRSFERHKPCSSVSSQFEGKRIKPPLSAPPYPGEKGQRSKSGETRSENGSSAGPRDLPNQHRYEHRQRDKAQ